VARKPKLSRADADRLLRQLSATSAGRDVLARWKGGMPKKATDDGIAPVMVHVAKLAKRQGLPETTVLAALVDVLPKGLRSQNVRPDSEWRRIYNKQRRGELAALPPRIKKLIGVQAVKKFDVADPGSDADLGRFRVQLLSMLRQRILFLHK
jgi:hypothetical protein